MDFRTHFGLLTLVLAAILALYGRPADACSCMPEHPQTHFCRADYVVQLRVLRKSHTIEPGKTTYKVQIKRTYKATPEARKMLRDGRLTTPREGGFCGVELGLGKVYVVAGRMPMLNLCNYYKEYSKMTITERHGINGVYAKSCSCEAKTCFGKSCMPRRRYADMCLWSPFSKCEKDYSACMPHAVQTSNGSVSRCRWRRTQLYRKCLSEP